MFHVLSTRRPIEELEIFVSPYRGLGRKSRNFSKYEFSEEGGRGLRRFKNNGRWEKLSWLRKDMKHVKMITYAS